MFGRLGAGHDFHFVANGESGEFPDPSPPLHFSVQIRRPLALSAETGAGNLQILLPDFLAFHAVAVVFDDDRCFTENFRERDFHHLRLCIPGVVPEFPECSFAGDVAFAEKGGEPRIDGEAGGGVHGRKTFRNWGSCRLADRYELFCHSNGFTYLSSRSCRRVPVA